MKLRNFVPVVAAMLFIGITTGCSKDDVATPPPAVISTFPVNGASAVALGSKITAEFSVDMDSSSISALTFTVKQGAVALAGTVKYVAKVATFTPLNALVTGKEYTATISTGVKDLTGIALATPSVWSFTTGTAHLGITPVALGGAANYVILAKSAINNTSTTAITGNLGLSPAATSYVTGFSLTNATGYATSAQVTGKVFAADMADPTPINLTTAVNNMITAYEDAAGRPTPDFLELATGIIGGKTLIPGLYKWTNSVTIPSNVTISGSANDVWIFQIAGDLNMSGAVKINLIGGAQAKNIFWQVAGQVTLGTTSHFEGIILSKTGVTLQTGASINGKVMAQTVVALDANTVVNSL